MTGKRIVAIGGSDAGISAAVRARELDADSKVTVVVADPYRELLQLPPGYGLLFGRAELTQAA